MMAESTAGALGHVRVLDLTTAIGQPCGRYLGDLGADVIKIEPPGGDPARSLSPFAGGQRDPERSIFFLHFNTNKRSVVLDLASPGGRAKFLDLARTADVVLESFSPGYLSSLGLGYDQLAKLHPGLVLTSLTPFGQTGPYRDFKGNDIIAVATSGLAFQEGSPGKAPFTQPDYQAYQQAGLHAAFGTLMALWERRRSGLGQHVDVSLQEVVAHEGFQIVDYSTLQEIAERSGPLGLRGVANFYPCKDGAWVLVSFFQPQQREALAAWLNDPIASELLRTNPAARRKANALLVEKIAAFVAGFAREEFLAEGARRRIPASFMNPIEEFVEHPHTKARRFFVQMEHPVVGPYTAPGAPAHYGLTPWRVRRPAPLVGQHTEEVLAELGQRAQVRQGQGGSSAAQGGGPLPLEGLRVLDFGRAWAGPFAARFLGDFGAEVIKVESTKFPDGRQLLREPDLETWRRSNGSFAQINRSKMSVTVDLHEEAGREVVRRLASICDVAIENYHPAALPRWGLGYEELHRVKPDLVMVSCPAYGNSGPLRDFFAMGTSMSAFVGMADLWGVPGTPRSLRSKNPYPDFIVAANVTLAVMAALHHRDRTGEGQHIEIAQVEATACNIGTAYLEYFLNGVAPGPRGNRDPNAAPQGIYPCKGDDRWCAISCTDEEEWQALRRVMGDPAWSRETRFATKESRWQDHDALDELLSSWTRGYTAHQTMYLCQRAGVPAGVVANGEDLYLDPHLRARGYVVEMEHPAPGRLEQAGLTLHLSRTPGQIRLPAPAIGGDNEYVFNQLLGMSEQEWIELTAREVLV